MSLNNYALSAEIKAAIDKDLPNQIGQTLKERLEKADKDAELLAGANERADRYEKERDTARGQLASAKEELSKHAALAAREAAVEKRERGAEIAELKVQLAAAQGNTEFARGVAMGLVRNIEFRNNSFQNSSDSVPVTNGGYTQLQTATHSNNVNETRSAT